MHATHSPFATALRLSAIAVLYLGSWASHAFAGHAQGNGGGIHRDSQNPWFLENTPFVRYCVDIDEAHFGVSRRVARAEIRLALRDWQQAFSRAEDSVYDEDELKPFGQLRIATQQFEEHSCDASVPIDIRFQLGRLTDEQRELFGNPKEFVGIAVRTSYDHVTMKGTGFVYLSPPVGPLAPNHGDLHPRAWTARDRFALKAVLRHELGHVFGLEHEPNTVMDDKWPEIFIDRKFLEDLSADRQRYFEAKTSVLRLFGYVDDWFVEGCGLRNPVFSPAIFGRTWLPDSCGRVEFDGSRLLISFRSDWQRPFELVAEGLIDDRHSFSVPAVSVLLPSSQTVFTSLPADAARMGRLFGESKNASKKWLGKLTLQQTGDILPVQIEADRDRASGTLFKDGHFESDVFFLE